MDKTVKTLIIVVIILVAVLGIVGGVFLQGYLSDNKNETVLNQTNPVNATVDNQTNQTKVQNNFISAQKAISISKQNMPISGEVRYSAKLVQNSNQFSPFYEINVYDIDPNSTTYGDIISDSTVDAKTGQFQGGRE
jgi:hypothetical protein